MSEARLLRSVQRLGAALSKVERITAADHGVSVSQLRCLLYLERNVDESPQGARVSDVATDQGLAVSTMTRNLALLEKKGWVSRADDPQDGRTVLTRLTEAGEEITERLNRGMLAKLSVAFKDFHPSDRVERAVALDRVAAALERVSTPGL